MHPAQTSAQKSSSAGLLVFNSSQALLSDKGIKQLAGVSRPDMRGAPNTVCRDRDGFYGRRREFSQIKTVPLESLARRQLECQFAGIHVVVGTVVDRDLEIHHGVAGQVAIRRRVHDALFHRGYEVLRNRTAKNLIGELEAGAARQRFHLDPAVAELPVTAGLFLVASLDIRLAANRLPVRY